MSKERSGRIKIGVAMLTAVIAVFALSLGVSVAFGAGNGSTAASLPCETGGKPCINIGYTRAWLDGKSVVLEYSHQFFCAEPPSSSARSQCEAGADGTTNPPSGAVVSPIYVLVPTGFTPSQDTLQCPVAGHCIDHPHKVDLSRVFGSSSGNVVLPPHSHVLEENESFQSTWWPVELVGVKTLDAWNHIASKKSDAALTACQNAGNCTDDIGTNILLFFQVLGPGMGPNGPD
ncbi:MAG: hypothetical protein M3O88_04520, partial [Actinomycetota bacterium]|nr:hypothetical protein [Actinomycetota bacterium]